MKRAGSGARPFENAMGEYQYIRHAQAGAMYEFICEFATLGPPPELARAFGNEATMDGFGEYRSDFAASAKRAHSVAATAESTLDPFRERS